MDVIYNLLEVSLPFSWVEYDFMKNALIAIFLISSIFGVIGTMVVTNKMAFFSDALGHSAFTGIAIGTMLGVENLYISMIAFALGFAYIIYILKRRELSSTDTIISVINSSMVALGIALLSINGDFSKYSLFLIGDIVSISPTDILVILVLAIATYAYWYIFSNKLLLLSVDKNLAKSKGIDVELVEISFMFLVAISVMIAIKIIGILLINSLVILPAAASKNISKNTRQYTLFSIMFALISGVSGLIISYYIGSATGPTIVIIATIIYALSVILQRRVA